VSGTAFATPSNTEPLVLHATTAVDGTYSFPGVPAGLYLVTASVTGASGSRDVDVSPAHTSAGDIEISSVVSDQSVTVQGTVLGLDTTGQAHPVQGAFVQFARFSICNGGGPVAGGQPIGPLPPCPAPLPLAASAGVSIPAGTPGLVPAGAVTDANGHYSLQAPA